MTRADAAGQRATSCYLVARSACLDDRVGTLLTVEGREYWLQGVRHPTVVVDKILAAGESSAADARL